MKEPTEKGKDTWPDGYYEGWPCVCTDECKRPCKGECGCEACIVAYSDFLSCDW
jgi:hypothetical protein